MHVASFVLPPGDITLLCIAWEGGQVTLLIGCNGSDVVIKGKSEPFSSAPFAVSILFDAEHKVDEEGWQMLSIGCGLGKGADAVCE